MKKKCGEVWGGCTFCWFSFILHDESDDDSDGGSNDSLDVNIIS
jgi:hypothetical protein